MPAPQARGTRSQGQTPITPSAIVITCVSRLHGDRSLKLTRDMQTLADPLRAPKIPIGTHAPNVCPTPNSNRCFAYDPQETVSVREEGKTATSKGHVSTPPGLRGHSGASNGLYSAVVAGSRLNMTLS